MKPSQDSNDHIIEMEKVAAQVADIAATSYGLSINSVGAFSMACRLFYDKMRYLDAQKVLFRITGENLHICQCGERMGQHHRDGDGLAPECDWWECDKCGFKTDPE